MKSLVYKGHIVEVRENDFIAEVSRNDETLIVDFDKGEVREEEREYIQEGIYLTWYVTEKGCAIRLYLKKITASEIARAARLAREMEEIFRMPENENIINMGGD